MTVEKIVAEILSRNPLLSREQVLSRLEKERRKTAGLISDEILLRMVAAEFGVALPKDGTLALTVSFKDLVPSLNDINATGRVVAVLPPRTFKGRRNGKFASLLIADQSGVLRVVLWNDKVDLVERDEVKVGQIIRVSHGYTREARDSGVELHVGEKGKLEINPENVEEKEYPTITKFATKISKITQAGKNGKVNVVGTVREVFPVSTFERQDSSSGKVMHFVVGDETGELAVVAWNEKAEALEKTLEKGARLQIADAKMKKTANGSVEVHVDSGTYAEVLAPESEFSRIADLKEGAVYVNIEGQVATKPMMREVRTSKGEAVRLAVFELKDASGSVWVSAWREWVDVVKDMEVDDRVVIRDGYVKKGFGDQLEVTTRSKTCIILPSKNDDASDSLRE
jgi:replication factor A1